MPAILIIAYRDISMPRLISFPLSSFADIQGKDLPYDLPENTEVELILKVYESRIVDLDVYIPIIDKIEEKDKFSLIRVNEQLIDLGRRVYFSHPGAWVDFYNHIIET